MRTILVLTGGSKTDEQCLQAHLPWQDRWAPTLTFFISEFLKLRRSAIHRILTSREAKV